MATGLVAEVGSYQGEHMLVRTEGWTMLMVGAY